MTRDEDLSPQQHCWLAEKHIAFARKGELRKIDVDRLRWAVMLMEKERNGRTDERP